MSGTEKLQSYGSCVGRVTYVLE